MDTGLANRIAVVTGAEKTAALLADEAERSGVEGLFPHGSEAS